MNRFTRLVIIVSLISACCTAIRADDTLEDMLDLEVLSGVCEAMTFHASLDFVLNAFDLTNFHPNISNGSADHEKNSPALTLDCFCRPVPGDITSRYGWRPQFNKMHQGVDLRLCIGDTVRSAMSGTIEKIAYDHGGYGNYIIIRHSGGMETLYGHLKYALVSRGQHIDTGHPIGIGGNTGNSTGPHLHFEARMRGVAIDPTIIFDFFRKSR